MILSLHAHVLIWALLPLVVVLSQIYTQIMIKCNIVIEDRLYALPLITYCSNSSGFGSYIYSKLALISKRRLPRRHNVTLARMFL